MKKRSLVLLSSLLLLTGCSEAKPATSTDELLEPSTEIVTDENTTDTAGSTEAIETKNNSIRNDLSSTDTQVYLTQLRAIASDDNAIYSPVSLYSALDLYKFCIKDSDGKSTIYDLLDSRSYLDYQIDDNYKLVNRIWVNKDKNLSMPAEVSDYVYEISFEDDEKATKEKNDYVAEQTNNFITSTPSVLNSDVYIDVMNVAYFKDTWKGEELSQLGKKKFNGTTNSTDVEFMSCYGDTYFENNTCIAVPIEYNNGMKFYAIQPKGELDDVDLTNLFLEEKYADSVYLEMPEFDAYSEINVNTLLSNVGAGNILASQPIYTEDIVDTRILQVAKIKVDHTGTEAAAVTEILNETGAMAPAKDFKYVEVILDKPFYYLIEDLNGDVAFIGRVTNFSE